MSWKIWSFSGIDQGSKAGTLVHRYLGTLTHSGVPPRAGAWQGGKWGGGASLGARGGSSSLQLFNPTILLCQLQKKLPNRRCDHC